MEVNVHTPLGLAKLIEMRTGDKELANKVIDMARLRLAEQSIPAIAKQMLGS